jgi:hypothetical protein
MDPVDQPAIEDAIRYLHGAEPKFVGSESVLVDMSGCIVWDGDVQVFDLVGHPTATRCYAWSYATDGGPRRVVAILHTPHVESPDRAVQAYLDRTMCEGT